MDGRKGFFGTVFGIALLFAQPALADSGTWKLSSTAGNAHSFILHIVRPGESVIVSDGPLKEDSPYGSIGGYRWTTRMKDALVYGMNYWDRILMPSAAGSASMILTTDASAEDSNASAVSGSYRGGNRDFMMMTALGASIKGGYQGIHTAWITLDAPDPGQGWQCGDMTLLPDNGSDASLAQTVMHEMSHALGIISSVDDAEFADMAGDGQYRFSRFDSCLRDSFGSPARPGQTVTIGSRAKPGGFVIRSGSNAAGVYFTGPKVLEVLNGAELSYPWADGSYGSYGGPAMPGIPVNGVEADDDGGLFYDFSHFELQNSSMSHQNYRNWNTLMEAELAALQDLGFELDRRSFFGYSIYGSGLKAANRNPYYARRGGTWDGTKPSLTPNGIGLHVYGSHNDILQKGDLLADGPYSIGIRVDGWDNAVSIAGGTRVTANGKGGMGLLVSYGRSQRISLLEGSAVSAAGADGIAVNFDFGDNCLSNAWEYRGSWLRTEDNGDFVNLLELPGTGELSGPLVSRFDVAGTIKAAPGGKAINIAPNALVAEIRFRDGADVTGDLVSAWDPQSAYLQAPEGTKLTTDVNLSLSPGRRMTFDGDIRGEESLELRLDSGVLDMTGHSAEVLSLESTFDADGHSGRIIADSVSTADDVITLRAKPGFYRNGSILLDNVVETPSGAGPESAALTYRSSTLDMAGSSTGDGSYRIDIVRPRDAYSRFASGRNGSAAGLALARAAGKGAPGMENLIAFLDFQAGPVGIGSALERMTPAAYAAMSRASLDRQHMFDTMLMHRMMAEPEERAAGGRAAGNGEWNVWAAPFATHSRWGGPDDSLRFRSTGGGFMAGAGRSLDNGLTQGIHIAAAAGRTEIRGNGSRGTSRGAYLGAHLDYAPGYWDGFHLMGAARIGIEDSELDRRIAISGYDGEYRTASSSCWTGLAGGIMAGAGKDWAFAGDRGAIKAGPLFWSGYAFARNPNIRENGGAAALAVRSGLKDSLHLNFGAHINADVKLNSRVSFTGDLLAGWRHELLENGSRTKAAFLGYGDSFDYSGRPAGRDALLVQAALRLTRDNGDGTRFFTQLDAGAERFRKKGTDLNFGFNLGFTF